MNDQHLIGQKVIERERPSLWVVAAFVASCTFTGSAMFLLFQALR